MKFVYIILIASFVGILFFIYKSGVFDLGNLKYKQATVTIRGEHFRTDVADTLVSRELGLGGRESIGKNEGMLFVFNSLGSRTFWMKDVGFSIDIIWLSGGKVVGFAENTLPHKGESLGKIARYKSPEGVDMVFEVAAGTVERLGVVVGDEVVIELAS